MIQYSRYQLTQRSALNRMDLSSVREGVLIKNGSGYGCIQPWPELGDATIEECLEDLRVGNLSNPLIKRALDSTHVISVNDGNERASIGCAGHLPSLLNHSTLPVMTGTEVISAVKAGFTAVKVKRGKDWMRMRKKTADMMEAFPDLRWRFDFNGALDTPLQLRQFLGSIPAERVDFIEDPFSDPNHAQKWRGVPIGYDRVIPENLNLENGFLSAKPALLSNEEVRVLAGDFPERVIFTSYMDHPVGQVFAMREAQAYYTEVGLSTAPLCGLVTHGLYERTPYSDLLGEPVPALSIPTSGALSKILETESWKPLNI